jgi:ketosteroid isomerase-like protein
MRKLLIGGTLGIVVVLLAACGDSSLSSAAEEDLQRKADIYEIDQIEKVFHGSMTAKDIDQMMSLYSPNATMTVGPGETASGLDEIRRFFLEDSAPFAPENVWISDHPAYKLEITVNGDRGTLHFECHFVDVVSGEVKAATAADLDVARIDGEWLITNLVGGTTVLEV